MNTEPLIDQLSKNIEVFKILLFNIGKDEIHFKTDKKNWSVLEIVCHLYDEEIEDFRYRTKHILETPGQPMPSINPEGWVKQRAYANHDYYDKINDFVTARNESINWLNSLSNPKWNNIYHHTSLGDISAFQMLTNWVGHDLLHIRQLTNLKFHFIEHLSRQKVTYAGNF